ncbi:unnamed protein product [Ceratitis capitata]|uniref:(Mediterranean fruit fly) hypothetical protein n=1 Tax=Ceratitis capitata TaxID=7213 RepID=A0A811US65_CERCA|nr:unnamed protein product [Ceratitis capitata]
MLSEFNANDKTISVKLTNFIEKTFDCILGINILYPIGAIINFKTKLMTVNNNDISLFNFTSSIAYEEKAEFAEFANLLPPDLNLAEKKLQKIFYKNKRTFILKVNN